MSETSILQRAMTVLAESSKFDSEDSVILDRFVRCCFKYMSDHQIASTMLSFLETRLGEHLKTAKQLKRTKAKFMQVRLTAWRQEIADWTDIVSKSRHFK